VRIEGTQNLTPLSSTNTGLDEKIRCKNNIQYDKQQTPSIIS